MRALLLLLLLAPPLFAIDLKDVDRDTLRYVRLALLKDEVRQHFGLRIGEFESLDQALSVKLDRKPLLVLRLGTKAAAVQIEPDKSGDRAGTHLFFDVETRIDSEAVLDGAYVAVRCLTHADGPQCSRLLRLHGGKLQLCFTWTSAEELLLEDSRYRIETIRTLATGPVLVETTECTLDGNPVEGGFARSTTIFRDTAEGLIPAQVATSPISVTQHCAISRDLERDKLNAAALHHARAALDQADIDKLAADDGRRLEAHALIARLEARLRPAAVQIAKLPGK
jgi:hypothetical protein